jgi:L-lactate utilization protein LutB
VNEQNANQENNSEIEEIQKIYEHIEEVKQEILHDVDERIVELIEKRFRK